LFHVYLFCPVDVAPFDASDVDPALDPLAAMMSLISLLYVINICPAPLVAAVLVAFVWS
jgi:hypothetical protein